MSTPVSEPVPDQTFELTISVLSFIFGLYLLIRREKALTIIGIAGLSVMLFVGIYSYVIPEFIPLFGKSELVHGLSALLLTFSCGLAVHRIAHVAVYFLLVGFITPLLCQILGVVWQLTPSEQWYQAKWVISLLLAVCISVLLVEHLEGTTRLTSILAGSLLVAVSMQFVFDQSTYIAGVEKCVYPASGAWASCTPFFTTWLCSCLISVAIMMCNKSSRDKQDNSHNMMSPLLPSSAPPMIDQHSIA